MAFPLCSNVYVGDIQSNILETIGEFEVEPLFQAGRMDLKSNCTIISSKTSTSVLYW